MWLWHTGTEKKKKKKLNWDVKECGLKKKSSSVGPNQILHFSSFIELIDLFCLPFDGCYVTNQKGKFRAKAAYLESPLIFSLVGEKVHKG